MSFHEHLKTEMQKQNMTCGKLHKISGIPESTLRDWVSGKSKPTISKAIQVSHALGLRLTDLVDD